MTEHTHDARGASNSEASLGAAVLVDGKVVAWFAEFNEAAEEWCTENHCGRWLAWRAKAPETVPLTPAEHDAAQRSAAELATLFEALPEAPTPNEGPAERRSRLSAGGLTFGEHECTPQKNERN